jgi:hypothetical protein
LLIVPTKINKEIGQSAGFLEKSMIALERRPWETSGLAKLEATVKK